MSILQIKGRTTNSQSDFDAFSLSCNSQVFTSAVASNIEEFSLELTLGDGWNDNYSDHNRHMRRIDESIIIRGHGSIVVEVQDEIRVPHNRYRVVLPTGSLFLSKGILITPAKVEPAFAGKLKLRRFNTTHQKILMKKGEKLGSVIFFATESTKVHDTIYRTREISALPSSRRADLIKWLTNNKTLWIGWTISIATSSLIAFLLTYSLYYKPMLENQMTTNSQSKQYLQENTIPVDQK